MLIFNIFLILYVKHGLVFAMHLLQM